MERLPRWTLIWSLVNLDDAADAMLVGFPTMLEWGVAFEQDADGHIWVELRRFGLTLLAERPPQGDAAVQLLRPVEPQVLVGPIVAAVEARYHGAAPDQWVHDDQWPGAHVVERPLGAERESVKVQVAVEPGARLVISPSSAPWCVRPATEDQKQMARLSAKTTLDGARARARRAEGPGYSRDERGEPVLSVRLHAKCAHDPSGWKARPCGHVHCPRCDGYVHPGTRVALQGPGPLVGCNRLWHHLDRYPHLFGENFAGSARLTQAMQKALGEARVRAPSDLKFGPLHDLLDKAVYERAKQEVKKRAVLYEHYSPPCRSFSAAQRQYQERRMDAPYGQGDSRPTTEADTKLAVRVCALARIKHVLGDFFSIEHPWPTPMLMFACFQELLALPGVFMLTWDNCAYGESYRHRQVLVTNAPFLAALSRDCSGDHEHVIVSPWAPGGLKASAVSPFSLGLVRHWAALFGAFVRAPSDQFCVHCSAACAARGAAATVPPTRPTDAVGKALRERLSRVLDAPCLPPQWDVLQHGDGEVVLRAVARLGAREETPCPSTKFRVCPCCGHRRAVANGLLSCAAVCGSTGSQDGGSADGEEERLSAESDGAPSDARVRAVRRTRETTGKRSLTEPVRKGAQMSYRKKQAKAAQLFPELEAEIEKRIKERVRGVQWAGAARQSAEFRAVLAEKSKTKIGGTPAEQRRFFDEIVAAFPQCFWVDGCPAPTVRDKVIGFRLKPNAKPVARQPIPVSPYDDLRVEYQIREFIEDGKLRKIDTQKEPLPEWATPVFIVDQDAKGMLGRLVCAYGPVNKELEISAFPSADPTRAFELAAGKSHHTVVDAIWGYTQFLIDEPTRKMLTICTRSGLYEWLRMPFGPAPAPAEMQSYVSTQFGTLRNGRGEEFVSPCMDDLKVSSLTFEHHLDDLTCFAHVLEREGL